jgi:hypothetical protein
VDSPVFVCQLLVNALMRQLAAKPLATDFHMFLMEGRRGRADAQ